MAPFRKLENPEDHVALAWLLEEGTRRFYSQAAEIFSKEVGSGLFRDLASAEDHHKAMLVSMYERRAGKPAGENFPQDVLPDLPKGMMEGGMQLEEALEWIRGRSLSEALELAISVEVNAYDRYLVLQRELPAEQSRDDFKRIAEQEKRHLEKLSQLLDDNLP